MYEVYIPAPSYDGTKDEPKKDLVFAFLDLVRSTTTSVPHYKHVPQDRFFFPTQVRAFNKILSFLKNKRHVPCHFVGNISRAVQQRFAYREAAFEQLLLSPKKRKLPELEVAE